MSIRRAGQRTASGFGDVLYETSPEGSREADLWMVSADGVNKYRMTNFKTPAA